MVRKTAARGPARPRKPKPKRNDGGTRSLRRFIAQTRREHARMLHRAELAQRQAEVLARRLRDAEAALEAAMERAGLEAQAPARRGGPPRKRSGTSRKKPTSTSTTRKAGGTARRSPTRGAGSTGAPRRGAGRPGGTGGTRKVGTRGPAKPRTQRSAPPRRGAGRPGGSGGARKPGTRKPGTRKPTGPKRPARGA